MNVNDLKTIGAGSTGFLVSTWETVEPLFQALIVLATAVYVVLRAIKAVRDFGNVRHDKN